MAAVTRSSAVLRSTRPTPMRPSATPISRRATVAVYAADLGRKELVEKIAARLDIPKTQAAKALEAFVDVVTEEVSAGNKVSIMGFGSWRRCHRAQRNGRNPHTGEALTIPAKEAAVFSAGANFKRAVNGLPEPQRKPHEAKQAGQAPKTAEGAAAEQQQAAEPVEKKQQAAPAKKQSSPGFNGKSKGFSGSVAAKQVVAAARSQAAKQAKPWARK